MRRLMRRMRAWKEIERQNSHYAQIDYGHMQVEFERKQRVEVIASITYVRYVFE